MTAAASSPRIVSIQVGLPQECGTEGAADEHDTPWRTGFYKLPVAGPVQAKSLGIVGDGVADRVHHGGIDKAVLAYSADHYPVWNRDLRGSGLLATEEMTGGAFGENLSITGLGENDVCIGDLWQAGDVLLEVSQPRQPCWKLSRRWRIADLAAQVIRNGKSGWYVRVVREGTLTAGLELTLVARKHPTWTIARVNDVGYHQKKEIAWATELAALPELAAAWREMFEDRVRKHRER